MTVRTFIAALLSMIVAAINAPQAQAVTISVAGEPSLVVPPIPPRGTSVATTRGQHLSRGS